MEVVWRWCGGVEVPRGNLQQLEQLSEELARDLFAAGAASADDGQREDRQQPAADAMCARLLGRRLEELSRGARGVEPQR